MASREDLRRAYLGSVVEIALPGAGLAVTAARPGTAEGDFPHRACGHLHVITACNPYSQVLAAAANAARNARLAADLDAAGLAHVPAVGRSPDDRWREPSFAVLDADEAVVLDLADRYDQHAVFVWTPSAWGVLWADADRGERDTTGWQVLPSAT